jgi:hypothetical protein
VNEFYASERQKKMRQELYFVNETYTIELIIQEAGINPHLSSVMGIIIIIWMYFILLFDNHIDLVLRLFHSNRFIL